MGAAIAASHLAKSMPFICTMVLALFLPHMCTSVLRGPPVPCFDYAIAQGFLVFPKQLPCYVSVWGNISALSRTMWLLQISLIVSL